MNLESAWNMYVFRDGRRRVAGASLVRAVSDALSSAAARPAQNSLINALLLAGELECALTDAASPTADSVAAITDVLAQTVVAPEIPADLAPRLAELQAILPPDPPAELRISPPEGFAYYALHPLDFADLAHSVPLHGLAVVVIGIRSIGVTLSALVLAALQARGIPAERLTVRPTGHPYNRETQLTYAQQSRVTPLRHDADFLIVDEGPGMSGSSFLSVGDALVAAGVPHDRIAFLGSRIPDPAQLRATEAATRWPRFRSYFSRKNSHLPSDACIYIGGGDWRHILTPRAPTVLASWTQMERLKFLSPNKRTVLKFEGFGPYGQSVFDRSRDLAESGFAPAPLDFTHGFLVYPFIAGPPQSPSDLNSALIERLAQYCAFRSRAFPAVTDNASEIETMMRFNVREEFGIDLPIEPGALGSACPVLVDGRMLPHEWILSAASGSRDHTFLKTDATSHCDDHFFPGPCDIAWDLAGAIVEWNMSDSQAEAFLAQYQRLTGDNPSSRLPLWITAYTIFRASYCKMAAASMIGSSDASLLYAAYERYRLILAAFLTHRSSNASASFAA